MLLLISTLNQHLTRFCEKTVNLLLDLRIGHHSRSIAVRARHAWCRSKEAANQRALTVYLASISTKIWTVEFGQRCIMLRIAFNRKPSHLFCRGRHRPTAIVASWFAFKCRNSFTKKTDYLTISRHFTTFSDLYV